MKAFVSLHTAAPDSQLDHEVSYEGYERVPVDFFDGFGDESLEITFPIIRADSDDVIHYIAVGACEEGQGEIFMRVPALPMELKQHPERLTREFWLKNGAAPTNVDKIIEDHGYMAPRVVICNTAPVKLPDNLNSIARVAHKLVYSGLMKAEDMHPKLFEAVNDALHNAGVPVLTVTRSSAANMEAKMSDLKSMQNMGTA